jgi:hypothetical protein
LHAPPSFPLQQSTVQPATAGLQTNWTFEISQPPASRSEGSTVEVVSLTPVEVVSLTEIRR